MKFICAMTAYVAMGLVLCLGILQAVRGSFWLLIFSLAGYVLAVACLGCLPTAPGRHPHSSTH